VQGPFKSGRLEVFRDLKYFLDEINSYQWEMDRTGELIDRAKKENDHLLDALRYALFSWSSERPLTPVSQGLGIQRRTAGLFRGF